MKTGAIGIFDSGLGGLTVVREVRKVLPNESIIYFGDTGRVPYGNRSAETIYRYALQDVKFLLSKRVKMVVVACGTVSTVAKKAGEGLSVPFTGVVVPAAKAAAAATKNGKIGVIATAASIASGAYDREIMGLNPDARVVGKACPLFVPLVENGVFAPDDPIVKSVVERYLEPFKNDGTDTLILGCTHYPILKEAIANYLGDGVTLIDTGVETAKYIRTLMEENDILNYDGAESTCRFFVSDEPQGFAPTASLLLGEDISGSVEHVDIEQY